MEGRGTGEHMAVGARTTMIGFGGRLLSTCPRLSISPWMGASSAGGPGFFLPALLQWREDRKGPLPPLQTVGRGGRDHRFWSHTSSQPA